MVGSMDGIFFELCSKFYPSYQFHSACVCVCLCKHTFFGGLWKEIARMLACILPDYEVRVILCFLFYSFLPFPSLLGTFSTFIIR